MLTKSTTPDGDVSKREIKEGIGTIGRINIVASLVRHKERALTIYVLISETGLKRNDVKENLEHLVAIGWVKEYHSVNIKYKFNCENERARLFAQFLTNAGYVRGKEKEEEDDNDTP